jgi:hypothetical protein
MTDKLATLANKYGAIGAIALFLTWWLASDVSGTLRALAETLNAHSSETAYYMRALCVNSADTPQKLANCQMPAGR